MLSAIILARNEEKNIKRAINSVSFADEVIVIDDNSTDKTVELSKKEGSVVYTHSLKDNFAEQRNFALTKTKGDWVLFLDADEVVDENLKTEILGVVNSDVDGYYIPRVDYLFGKKLTHGEYFNFKVLRLAKRNAGTWRRSVHETWRVKGKIRSLKNPLLHYPHETIKEFVDDIEKYSTLHAKEKYDGGEKSSLIKIIFYPIGKFIYNFFIKLGFLDGNVGFIVSMLMSFHSFLSWSKLWLLQRKLEYKKY